MENVVNITAVIPEQAFAIDGVSANQFVSSSAIACDLDEDGVMDVILGNALNSSNRGTVNVIWGSPFNTVKPNTTSDMVPPLAFSISGSTTFQYVGASLACVDINQDGHKDLLIGAYGYQPSGRGTAGGVYAIYFNGTRITANINVEALSSSQGFVIPGTANTDQFGYAMDNAGDVNGDGWDDVIISAPYASGTGKAYLIYSQPGLNAFDANILSTNATAGFMLQGTTGSSFGHSVRKAGDFNNDGYADIVIGAFRSNFAGINTGSAYVVFGDAARATPTFVNALENMIRFDGNPSGQQPRLGFAVGHAGHFDNDPYSDIVISAPFESSPTGTRSVGYSFVIFGKPNFPSITNVNALGSDAFKLYGREAYASLGYSVAGGDDINGDGFDDVVLGEHYSFLRPDGERDGAAYVLFGNQFQRNTVSNINTLTDTQGYTLRDFSYGRLGHAALELGDINNDGYSDILIAAPLARPNGITSAGIFYAISGRLRPIVTTSNNTVNYTKDAVPVAVDSGVTVTDNNNPTIASAKIAISEGFMNGDNLSFINQNGITGQYNAGTGILTLTGVASVENYETALRNVTFQTDKVSFSNRNISFMVNNGAKDSIPAIQPIQLVSLNDLLIGSENNVLCLTQENSQLVFPQLKIIGGNTLTLQNATITIDDAMGSEDSLTFSSLNPQISGNYNNSTGVLILTGPATASEFEATLRTVAYQNSNNADTTSIGRNITATVNFEGEASNSMASEMSFVGPLLITNPMPDFNVTADEPFAIALENNIFNFPETELNLSVQGADSDSASLSYDRNTRQLRGVVPFGQNRFSFFGVDNQCHQTAISNFTINAAAPETSPESSNVTTPEPDKTGPLVGGIVGGFVGLLLLLGGIFLLVMWRRNRKQDDNNVASEPADAEMIMSATGEEGAVTNNPAYKDKKKSWYNQLYKSFRNLVVVTSEKPASSTDLPVVANDMPIEPVEKSNSSNSEASSAISVKLANNSEKKSSIANPVANLPEARNDSEEKAESSAETSLRHTP